MNSRYLVKLLQFVLTSLLLFLLVVNPVHALPGAHSYTNTSNGDVFLGGNYIEVGISKFGSFGTSTGVAKPAGFYGTASGNNIGMSTNAAGFGESPDTRIDFFLPGTPEERWAVGYKIGGTPTTGSNAFLRSVTNISDYTVTNESSGNLLKATGSGTLNSKLKITQVISFTTDDKYFKNVVTLQNVDSANLDSVRYMRSFDPDNTAFKGGSSATSNRILYTHAAGDGKAVVIADTSNNNSDPVYLVNGTRSPILFYSADTRARVSTWGFANSNPYDAAAYDSADAKGTAEVGDQGITITVDVGTLAPGASSTFTYFTSLDNRDFDEVIEDIQAEESQNNAPDAPTSLGASQYVNGSGGSDTTPTLAFSLSDADATNSAKFRIQIDDTANFSSPVVDYTSALAAQGSRNFTVGQAAGSGSYTVGSSVQTLSDGSYYWRVKAIDDFEIESAYSTANGGSVAFIVNTTTPGVSAITATVDDSTAQVTWTTDSAASSQVEYGLTSNYGFQTSETNTSPRVTSHDVSIGNLKACTRYFYRVKVRNNANTLTTSAQKTFTTTGCSTSSIVSGSEGAVDKTTGGDLTYTNNSSLVTLAIPANYATQSASFQINKLETSAHPAPPSGKALVEENLFDFVAVTEDDEELTTFDDGLTFTVNYGSSIENSYEEGTLDVYYYNNGIWEALGCAQDMAANTLTCTLDHFSTYGVFGQTKAGTVIANQSNSSGGGDCHEPKPSSTPDLFQIDTNTATAATVYFTPISNTNTYYISYSTKPGAEEHGLLVTLSSEGVQAYTVDNLLPSIPYYFKVRGQKGCTPGDWSGVRQMSVITNATEGAHTKGSLLAAPEKVLGTTDQKIKVGSDVNAPDSASESATVVPVESESSGSAKEVTEEEQSTSWFQNILNTVKSWFSR